MTTEEERRERYAEMDRKLAELKASLEGTGERQRELDGRSREMRDRSREQLAEAREDTKRTRRLWDRLAAKHGWPNYDDLEEDGG